MMKSKREQEKAAETEKVSPNIPVEKLLESLIEHFDSNEDAKNTLLNTVIDVAGKRYCLTCYEVQDPVHLSPRETEVAYLLTQGCLVKEIAHKLEIKKSTITTYVSRIYNKLNVTTRADMVREVVIQGLVPMH